MAATKLKPMQCNNCIFFDRHSVYKTDGFCQKDGDYTRETRVCNNLKTDSERRNAKIKPNGN